MKIIKCLSSRPVLTRLFERERKKLFLEVIKKGKQLFYKNAAGEEIQIKRIYNRVIFDELDLRKDLQLNFNFSDDLDVEWAGHPNWFFRISNVGFSFFW